LLLLLTRCGYEERRGEGHKNRDGKFYEV